MLFSTRAIEIRIRTAYEIVLILFENILAISIKQFLLVYSLRNNATENECLLENI